MGLEIIPPEQNRRCGQKLACRFSLLSRITRYNTSALQHSYHWRASTRSSTWSRQTSAFEHTAVEPSLICLSHWFCLASYSLRRGSIIVVLSVDCFPYHFNTMTSAEREYELVLFGATGYTGKLCAEHIITHLPTDLRWAVAGRSASKLSAVLKELKHLTPDRLQPGTS